MIKNSILFFSEKDVLAAESLKLTRRQDSKFITTLKVIETKVHAMTWDREGNVVKNQLRQLNSKGAVFKVLAKNIGFRPRSIYKNPSEEQYLITIHGRIQLLDIKRNKRGIVKSGDYRQFCESPIDGTVYALKEKRNEHRYYVDVFKSHRDLWDLENCESRDQVEATGKCEDDEDQRTLETEENHNVNERSLNCKRKVDSIKIKPDFYNSGQVSCACVRPNELYLCFERKTWLYRLDVLTSAVNMKCKTPNLESPLIIGSDRSKIIITDSLGGNEKLHVFDTEKSDWSIVRLSNAVQYSEAAAVNEGRLYIADGLKPCTLYVFQPTG